MADPVNRCQSPISTANPNPVSVDTPRRQHSRRSTRVNSLFVGTGPRLASGVDDPVRQKQFRQPTTAAHQVTPDVLPRRPVSGSLLFYARHPHEHDLVHPQHPGQMKGVPGIGLQPVTRRALQLDGAATRQRTPGTDQLPGQPEPGRPCLIRHRNRRW